MSGNENGLYMYNCGSIDVVGNDFSLEENEGIYLEWCHGLSISLNNVSSNGVDGIHLRTCDGIQSVTDNLVYDNPVGMYFDQSAPEVIGNEIVANGAGMELLWASGVLVYHNDFIANTVHVSASNTMFSRWNDSYPSGGNYWDNYTGIDVKNGPLQDQNGSDGIGDTPMVFAPGLEDMYPLMAMNGTNRPPVASFTVEPNPGDLMSNFEFNASSSFDYGEDQSALEVRWDYDGDGTWDTGWSSVMTSNHMFSTPGTYNVTLEVRDPNGAVGTRMIQVVVMEQTIPEFDGVPVLVVTILGAMGTVLWLTRSRARVG
jgi:parallel beta-helix repeat protein